MAQETAAQNIKNRLKSSTENEKTEEIKRKPTHGQFYPELERTSVDKEKFMVWLCSSGLKGVTESLTITTQDQALKMCYNQRNIMEQPNHSKFRTCYKADEHLKHIVVR